MIDRVVSQCAYLSRYFLHLARAAVGVAEAEELTARVPKEDVMAYPTHYCLLCKRKHDAGYWYHRTVNGKKEYACGSKYNELPPEERGKWLHQDD